MISIPFSRRSVGLQSAQAPPDRPGYRLIWKQKTLFVEASEGQPDLYLEASLTECLQRSFVHRVCLHPDLGEARLMLWGEASLQANKAVFLRLQPTPQIPQKRYPIRWRIKRSLDWSAAVCLLSVLSPLILGIAIALRLFSPGPIFSQQCRVGERGRLFWLKKFRTIGTDTPKVTGLGQVLRRLHLEGLPQLFNVLRGEMSLVGARPWELSGSLRISPELQYQLNALPGITGVWYRNDLQYLEHWSLWQDLKLLLLSMPRALSRFGVY
jgi:lipopolysaccharide/colanic/teichoic acid biosynthesis glycosyltransferase